MSDWGVDHVIGVVVVTDSSSLISVRKWMSVYHPRLATSRRDREALGASLEATSRTSRKIARAESRWSDEGCASSRLMCFDVRREVVLSQWEIQVTRLRAESCQPPACPSKAVLVASAGCVMERSFANFRIRSGSGWGSFSISRKESCCKPSMSALLSQNSLQICFSLATPNAVLMSIFALHPPVFLPLSTCLQQLRHHHLEVLATDTIDSYHMQLLPSFRLLFSHLAVSATLPVQECLFSDWQHLHLGICDAETTFF